VKELRIAQGWTQEQLAQAAGVSRKSINSSNHNRYVLLEGEMAAEVSRMLPSEARTGLRSMELMLAARRGGLGQLLLGPALAMRSSLTRLTDGWGM